MSGIRFVFLSDTHIVEPVNPVMRRVFAWARDWARSAGIRELVLGGDMTHHASAAQALAALDAVAYSGARLHVLPGNNEGAALAWDPLRHPLPVRGLTRLDWPGLAFALAAVDAESLKAGLAELAAALPEQGTVLVFAHLPPDESGPVPDAFRRVGLAVTWICGHAHEAATRQAGSIKVVMCGGLDPVKVRGHLPELLAGEWDGRELSLERVQAPLAVLRSPAGTPSVALGIACSGPALPLLEAALAHGIMAIQFRNGELGSAPSAADRAAAARHRKAFPGGLLSLHLSTMTVAAGKDPLEALESELGWAEAMGVDDLTLHLPKAPVGCLFDGDERIRETPWAQACLEAFVRLAERALAMGAGLSIENMYNKSRMPPVEELLSSRPWHLLRFAGRLREELIARGHTAGEAARVGLLFDAGHAFRDPLVSKTHGLGDWIQRLSPMLRLAHLHQVLELDGKLSNHHPVTNLFGPRINFAGLLPLFQEAVPRPIPLLIEVRDIAEALASRDVIVRGMGG